MWLACVVMIVGLIIYMAVNGTKAPEIKESGRIMFAFGLLVALLKFGKTLAEVLHGG